MAFDGASEYNPEHPAMGTHNAIYIRAPDARVVAAVRGAYRGAYAEVGSEFVAVDQPLDQFECPERELADLSARLGTDVLWLSFQSVVDAFQFYHWDAGRRARSLVYGCFEQERTWERVEGVAEPWERAALFDPGTLKIAEHYRLPGWDLSFG